MTVLEALVPLLALVGDISGRVTDPRGTPLGGAVIVVEGTRFSGVSGADGAYRILGVPDGRHTLRVRRIGHAAWTDTLTIAAGNVTRDIVLRPLPTPLEQVIITGTLTRTEAKSVPGAVSIIMADEIEARGITKVEEIFRTVAGVSALSDGQSNYVGNVTIRGGNTIQGDRTTKLLIDGVEVADDGMQLNNIDPASIERVEIFRGPQASTIYGSAASGGLIQIITKKGEYTTRKQPRIDARVSAGYVQTTNRHGNGSGLTDNLLSVTGGGPGFSYRVGGGLAYQGNWIPNSEEALPSIFGHVRTTQGRLLLEANVRYLSRRFGWLYNPELEVVAPSIFEGINAGDELNVSRTQAYNLHALYQASPHWTHDLILGVEQVGLDYWTTKPTDTLGTQSISINTWAQPSVKYRMGFDRSIGAAVTSSLIVGADYSTRTQRFFSWTGIGDPNAGAIPSGGRPFVQSRYLHSTAFYAQEVLGVGRDLHFTFGVRADRQLATTTPVEHAWSPRAGVAYTRSFGGVTARIRTSFGAVPSPIPSNALLDLVRPPNIYRANPALRSPQLRGVDAGLELFVGGSASFIATYFDQRATDQIDLVVTQQDSAGFVVSTWQNIGEVRNRGWEFEGRLALGRLTLMGTYSPLRGVVTRLSPDYDGNLVVGANLFNVPDWTASLTASLTLPRTMLLVAVTPTGPHANLAEVRLYGAIENGTFDPARFRELYVKEYRGFTKVNLSASREISRGLQGFVSVQDLLNDGAIETSDWTVNRSRVTRVGVRISR